ncbi:hypothetical protein NHX12_014441 [Muraenolepis orangiensis]|uniref:B30.2/SPRY domain-containing protein n=1 Tax=Muraenolepis orangiensis TaxID=630683 RepID=A0A9Q0DFJ5_9TELE|nr:hypothetical protein NHX12_014441 [Muraenolepis orangiensis]
MAEDLKGESTTRQSSSIGAVRWPQNEQYVQAHSSAPSKALQTSTLSTQPSPRQNSLKDLRSLQVCVQFINDWKAQVDQVCKGSGAPQSEASRLDGRAERSLEQSRKLIREWAGELQHIDKSCGIEREELGQMLRLLGIRKKRLVHLLPLLEFITCVPGKQGFPADVTLDPMTNHPWLHISEDQRGVQEGRLEAIDLPQGPQRFDSWPCVTGWQGYDRGRHYWEVDIANTGYWRAGVTAADAKRRGRLPMTPHRGYWALWRSPQQFYACTEPEAAPLPAVAAPRRLAIYLDYEEGQVSFYNAETRTHIYTFTGNFRGKLYPLFAPLDGRTCLTVRPPPNAGNL